MNDRTQFEEMFAQSYGKILNYAVRRLLSMDDAEDVVSETFRRALSNWDEIPKTPRVTQAWLYRTATNLIHDQYRRQKRRPEVTLDEPESKTSSLEQYLADPSPDPEERLAQLQQFTGIRNLVVKLKPKYQDVLALRFFEEKSIDEIAAILKKRPGTVKWRLHTGLKKLEATIRKQAVRSSARSNQS